MKPSECNIRYNDMIACIFSASCYISIKATEIGILICLHSVAHYNSITFQQEIWNTDTQTFNTGSPLLELAACFAAACCCARAALPAADFSNSSCLQ